MFSFGKKKNCNEMRFIHNGKGFMLLPYARNEPFTSISLHQRDDHPPTSRLHLFAESSDNPRIFFFFQEVMNQSLGADDLGAGAGYSSFRPRHRALVLDLERPRPDLCGYELGCRNLVMGVSTQAQVNPSLASRTQPSC